MGGKGGSSHGTDRARNYAWDIQGQTQPIWQNMLANATAVTTPGYDPTQNAVFRWAQNQLGGATKPQSISGTDAYQTLQGLYAPWQSSDYASSPIYQQMNDLYTQQAQPLYDQMLDPLKRNMERQYQTSINQILSSSPRGGAMAAALSGAAMNRAQGLADLEKQLRTQDILRQDTLNQAKTSALANVLSGLEATRQNIAGQLGSAAMSIGSQQQDQQMAANQLLTALLSNQYQQDQSNANALGLYGQQQLQNILNQQSAGAQNAATAGNSGLTSMMSTLGLGAGLIGSKYFGNSSTPTTTK